MVKNNFIYIVRLKVLLLSQATRFGSYIQTSSGLYQGTLNTTA
jgi:hypothetical protein